MGVINRVGYIISLFSLLMILFLPGEVTGQILSISDNGQTGTSGSNWSTSGTTTKIITATGTADISTSVIEGYLNQGLNVEIRDVGGLIQIEDPITKSSGDDATLTIRSYGRVDVWTSRHITSSAGKLNVVLWSDYDNTNSGGVTLRGNIVSNGGHVWLGGSSTVAGSYRWNGLTVGNGPSEGASGTGNANGMDLFANVTTNGGDFLAWAGDRKPGSGGIDGIGNDGAGDVVNTGSGDIILITDRVDGDGSTAIFFESTGHFYLLPNDGAFKETFVWNPTVQSTYIDFGGNWNYMAIRNPQNHTGLTLGQYTGMTTSSLIPVVLNNTSDITISRDIATNGPISMYGGTLQIGANLNSSSANGDILLEGSTKVFASIANRSLTSGSGNITLTANDFENSTVRFLITSTGTLTIQPYTAWTSTFLGGAIFNFSGTLTSGTFTGSSSFPESAWLIINSIASLSGFTLGRSDNSTNSTNGISIDSPIDIAGPVSVYGGSIDVNANITATGGHILLDADFGNTLTGGTLDGIQIDNGITIKTVNSGNITLIGRSGDAAGIISGIDMSNSAITTINAAGNISITGRSFATSSSGGRGVDMVNDVLTAGGSITITGQHDNQSSFGVALGNTDLTAGSGITLRALDELSDNKGFTIPYNGTTLDGGAGAVQLIGQNIDFSTGSAVTISTTGSVSILPENTAFASALDIDLLTIAATATGLTIGTSTNTTDITIGTATNIAGPISLYGNAITLNADISTTDAATGNILLQGTGLTGTGNVTVASGRTATINTSGNSTYAGIISGTSSSLEKQGAGTLTLSGTSTYTGSTAISDGKLQLNKTGGTSIPSTNNVNISGGTLTISSNQELNDLTVSTGTLEVDNNVVLTNNGVFTGGGTIINNGTMVLKGSSSFPGSSSTINAMNNLTIDRSAGVTLNKDMSVTGILTLSSGVFDLGAATLFIASTGSITGASSNRYIKTSSTGVLKMPVGNNSSIVFPVGKAYYNPVGIKSNTNNDEFTVRVDDALYMGGQQANPRLEATWFITKREPNGQPGVDFTFEWDDSQEQNGISTYRLQHYNGTSWEFASGNSSVPNAASSRKSKAHSGYTGTFSPFAIGETTVTLPVTWHSFTATQQSSDVLLKWATASELNTKDFVVEYSTNALNWSTIGTVAAAGNSSSVRNYSLLHKDPIKGEVSRFYRIKQRDLDGKVSYSKILRLQMHIHDLGLSVYPNPAKDVLNVYLPESQALRIVTITGAEVWRSNLVAGNHKIRVGHLSRGTYILVTPTQTKKIILD